MIYRIHTFIYILFFTHSVIYLKNYRNAMNLQIFHSTSALLKIWSKLSGFNAELQLCNRFP